MLKNKRMGHNIPNSNIRKDTRMHDIMKPVPCWEEKEKLDRLNIRRNRNSISPLFSSAEPMNKNDKSKRSNSDGLSSLIDVFQRLMKRSSKDDCTICGKRRERFDDSEFEKYYDCRTIEYKEDGIYAVR